MGEEGGEGEEGEEGAVVKLTEDVTITSTINIDRGIVTIDLGGHKLTGTGQVLKVTGGKVYLKNGSVETPETLESDAIAVEGAMLAVDSVKVTAYNAFGAYHKATIKLSADTVGAKFNVLYVDGESEAEVKSGAYQSSDMTIVLKNGSTLNVAGGEYKSVKKVAVNASGASSVNLLGLATFEGGERGMTISVDSNIRLDTSAYAYITGDGKAAELSGNMPNGGVVVSAANGLSEIRAERRQNETYDIQGRRVGTAHRGVVIAGGKVRIRR